MVIIKAIEGENIIEYTNYIEDEKSIVIMPKNSEKYDANKIIGEKITLFDLINKIIELQEDNEYYKKEIKELNNKILRYELGINDYDNEC